MEHYSAIEKKLEQFYKKYYINQLLKGSLLFLTFGLSYFILTSFIEYFLWLPKVGRVLLFWLFVGAESGLLFFFIVTPLLKLLKATRGIKLEELSSLVGKHFKEVEDKLLNVLQLRKLDEQSDLLIASIEQKSKELVPIPFNKAINFKVNLKYVKYLIAPLFLVLILFFTNLVGDFSDSFSRIVNYKQAYTPPAPFTLVLDSKNLQVIQGKDFTVRFSTAGKIVPSEAKIVFQNQEYFLTSEKLGEFQFTFSQVQENTFFYVVSNGIRSIQYELKVIKTPTIKGVVLDIDYPKYTKQKDQSIPSQTNVIVPEGTKITWNISTLQTSDVSFSEGNKTQNFSEKEKNEFVLSKQILNSFNYTISTTNQDIKDYESLNFSVTAIPDEYPKIDVQSIIDSTRNELVYLAGKISDDYGLAKLNLVYYPTQHKKQNKVKKIKIGKETLQTFLVDVSKEIEFEKGLDYELFFEVFDNDGIHGAKKTTSKTFSYRLKTQEEKEEQLLQEQKNQINDLENTLINQKKQRNNLKEIQQNFQNKKNVNWNDSKKLQDLLKRQRNYQKMMQKQSNNLLQNFDEKQEENESLQKQKEELKKRIDELKDIKRQEQLLKELERLADKLNKDELIKKTKQLAQQNKQQERSLERILELTKRFYVEQKTTQLANKLENLAKKQHELSKKDSLTIQDQQKLNKEFNDIQEELKELDEDNQKLRSPMSIPDLKQEQSEVSKDQKEAEKNLSEKKKKQAKENQKQAADKMKKMSQKIMQSLSDMQANMISENVDDLRKILKNILTFSFQQEDLMDVFNKINERHPDFGKNLRKQHEIKTYFEHIDDSLYVLSMRVPQISTKLQEDLSSVHYNLRQSLENFSERRFSTGVSNQRYAITATNNITDFLSDLLANMQNKMSSSGKGKKSNSFSLPTLIKQQKGLSDQMKKGLEQQSNQGKKKEGENNEDINGETYKIYQQQSMLRQQLEDILNEGSNESNKKGKEVLKRMEELENEILEKGVTPEALQRMQNLEYQLLKLEDATLKQNKDDRRKSNTNTEKYIKNNVKKQQLKKLFYNQVEILNRQSLPLQQIYRKKVQEYFSDKKDFN